MGGFFGQIFLWLRFDVEIHAQQNIYTVRIGFCIERPIFINEKWGKALQEFIWIHFIVLSVFFACDPTKCVSIDKWELFITICETHKLLWNCQSHVIEIKVA